MMNNDGKKLNLPSIQYYQLVGDNNQLITYLNCFQSCVYHAYITERMVKDEDLYEIFLGDITFGIIEETNGSVYDIEFMDNPTNELGFKFIYTLGRGPEVLPAVEALIDLGKAVIVQTYMQRVPFFANFRGFDFALNEEHYRQNYHTYHTFLVVGYDRDNLYYVESPYVINKERFLPYENNSSIGVIAKKELIPAFNMFFNHTYLKFDEAQAPGMLDNLKPEIVKKVIAKSAVNYYQKVREEGGKIYFCGKAALDRLNWYLQNGMIDLRQAITHFNIDLNQLFVWKLQFVLNRRYVLARALEKNADHLRSYDIDGLVDLLNSNIKAWRVFLYKLRKIQAKKETAYSGLAELSNKIVSLEEQIIAKLS